MADAAIAGGWLGPLSEWRTRLFGGLADRLAAEGERRLLWLPVFFGAGIGVYFLLKVEPPLWPGIAAAIAGVGSVVALRRYRAWCEAALAFTVFAAGFALMRETAWEREAPMLQRHLGPIAVTGRVIDIDLMEKGWRIVIDADPLPGLDAERSAAPPARAYPAEQRRAQPRRPRQPQGDALSGAGADLAGRARFSARALFRRDRRGRLHLWRRASDRRAGERRRLARESAAAAHRDDAADRRRAPRLDRRRRLGADHRQTRRDHRRGQAGLPRFRSVASAGDRRPAFGARRRLCVFRRARRLGADPADRIALSDQEDRRRRRRSSCSPAIC